MQGTEAQAAPPVNNLLQPDVYNRLDAHARERTRVVNSQLDHRLMAQQSILAKYRTAAERFYRREKDLVVQELNRISTRLPAVSRIPDFRNKFFYGERLNRSQSQSLPDVRAKKIRGVPEEKPEQPFCHRYFLHHLPTKRKYYRTALSVSSRPYVRGRGGGDTVDLDDAELFLPPLTENETSTTPKPDTNEVKLTPVQNNNNNNNNNNSSNNNNNSKSDHDERHSVSREDNRVSSKSDGVAAQRVRNGNGSVPVSDEGRQPDRVRSLPPLSQQNLRLAHSSPQLYFGESGPGQ